MCKELATDIKNLLDLSILEETESGYDVLMGFTNSSISLDNDTKVITIRSPNFAGLKRKIEHLIDSNWTTRTIDL